MSAPGASALVCCVGNELVGDDAVGHRIYGHLQTLELPAATQLTYLGLGGLDMLEQLSGEERALIVVDAVHFGAEPGTVHCLEWDDLPAARGAAVSAHGIGLRETIEVGRVICPEKVPARIMLVGIEGRLFSELGGAMTPATEAAVPVAAERVRELLYTIQRGIEG